MTPTAMVVVGGSPADAFVEWPLSCCLSGSSERGVEYPPDTRQFCCCSGHVPPRPSLLPQSCRSVLCGAAPARIDYQRAIVKFVMLASRIFAWLEKACPSVHRLLLSVSRHLCRRRPYSQYRFASTLEPFIEALLRDALILRDKLVE